MYRVGSVILLTAFCAVVDAAEVRLAGQVVDPLTGRPVPCRIYVEGPPGTFHLVRSASSEGSAVPMRNAAAGALRYTPRSPAILFSPSCPRENTN